MFKHLRILTLMQLSEKVGVNRSKSKSKTLGVIGKNVFFMALSYGLFVLLFYLMFNLLFMRASVPLIMFLVAFIQLLSIVTCTLSLSHDLYTSKDNMILMTYPVKHVEIFISKLIVVYLLELRKSLVMTFPLLMAYATVVTSYFSANYVIGSVFYAILLPLAPVLIGSLISIPFVYLSKTIKRASWVKGIFSLLLFGLLIYVLILLVNWLNEIGEIRIVALWNTFLNNFQAFLDGALPFELYVNFVGNSLVNSSALQIFLNYLYFILVIAGLVGLVILAALPTFYKLSSRATEKASVKAHRGINKTHKSTFFTFFRKELTLALRNLSNFASDYVFLFAMPFILILLTTIFTHINRNNLGYTLTYGIIALITLILLAVSNTASATAISSEGNEFVLLKTAPGETKNIIWSKLLLNFIIAFGATLFSYILLSLFLIKDVEAGKINLGIIWMIFVFSMFLEIGALLGAIQYDILNPRLREYANSENKNDIKNSARSIISGLVTAFVGTAIIFLAVLLIIPAFESGAGLDLAILITSIILAVLGLGYALLKLFFLVQYRNAYFEDIQL